MKQRLGQQISDTSKESRSVDRKASLTRTRHGQTVSQIWETTGWRSYKFHLVDRVLALEKKERYLQWLGPPIIVGLDGRSWPNRRWRDMLTGIIFDILH